MCYRRAQEKPQVPHIGVSNLHCLVTAQFNLTSCALRFVKSRWKTWLKWLSPLTTSKQNPNKSSLNNARCNVVQQTLLPKGFRSPRHACTGCGEDPGRNTIHAYHAMHRSSVSCRAGACTLHPSWACRPAVRPRRGGCLTACCCACCGVGPAMYTGLPSHPVGKRAVATTLSQPSPRVTSRPACSTTTS